MLECAMNDLKGKKVLVTGGAGGIGAACCRELAGLGAELLIHYRSSENAARDLKAELESGGAVAGIFKADLTIETEVRALAAEAERLFGRLDGLVNNAGDLLARRWLPDLDDGFFSQVMRLNINSLVMLTRQVLPLLEKAGADGGASIVNLASLAGRKGGHAGSLAYSTAKGAVITFTRALSGELAGRGVRVNCVAPGLVLGTKFHATHTTRQSADQTIAGIPLGRAGTPEDIGRAVAFLCSEYHGFITGATIDINGGVYCA
jgi:3-oxoacyl-[acyl-carrier protein] reductase